MSAKLHFLCGTIVAASAVAPLQAFANGTQPLPGVQQPKPIVQAPQPEPDEQPTSKPGTFKVGNFDVKVSGSVTVDVGVGRIKPPR